jgi:hypothetical protein
MDDDSVLQSLGADLARDDPRLAALLSGTPVRAHRLSGMWLALALPLLVLPMLTAALLLPARITLGVAAMVFILASPLAACWLCAVTDRSGPDAPR